MKSSDTSVLITAGATWAALDAVRVIGNIATGQTGKLLAKALARRKARVTLLLGPGESICDIPRRCRVRRFTFFHEAMSLVEREIRAKKYDCVVHTAAMCDYLPAKVSRGKVPSGKIWNLQLKPSPKIIDRIKSWDPAIHAIGFKYEPQCPRSRLLKEARGLMKRSRVDAVAANTVRQGAYEAYLVTARDTGAKGPYRSKATLVAALAEHIAHTLWKTSN